MRGELFVIQLANGSFWISRDQTTRHIDGAQQFDSRWVALAEMSKAGPVMHMANIVPYRRPIERALRTIGGVVAPHHPPADASQGESGPARGIVENDREG